MPTPTATPRPADREAASPCRRKPTRFEEGGSWSTVSMCAPKGQRANRSGFSPSFPGSPGVPAGPASCRASSCDMRSARTAVPGSVGSGPRMACPGYRKSADQRGRPARRRSSRTSRRRPRSRVLLLLYGCDPCRALPARGLDLPHCTRTIPADARLRSEFDAAEESGLRGSLLRGSLLRRGLFRGSLLGGRLFRRRLVAAGPRLDAGFQLGQQIRDVFGFVELFRLFFGGKRFSAFEFGLHQLLQLLLVVVVITIRVEFVGHRLDH